MLTGAKRDKAMDDLFFKYVDTAGVSAFEKFAAENIRGSKDIRKGKEDAEFKFE